MLVWWVLLLVLLLAVPGSWTELQSCCQQGCQYQKYVLLHRTLPPY
jgi:hypothetical protein